MIKSNYYEKCDSLKISEGSNKLSKNNEISNENKFIEANKQSINQNNTNKQNIIFNNERMNSFNNNLYNNNSKNNKYDNNRGSSNNNIYNENDKYIIKANNYEDYPYEANYKEMKNNKNNNNYEQNYNYNYEFKKKYSNNNKRNKNIIYQDFYYKEITYGSSSSSSSNRSSIKSQLNNKNNNDELRKSFPEDNNRNILLNNLEKEPEDEFSRYIFKEINNIRKNPKSFIEKIESSKKNIIIDKRNNCIYKGKQKISLNNGVYAFENTIKHLKILRPMNELIYSPNMNIKLPFNEEEINNRNYQHDMIEFLRKKNKININSFWREIIKDPEECFLLMIVDDCGTNCGNKRKDLLDNRIKYIGINSIKIGKYFACYIELSK